MLAAVRSDVGKVRQVNEDYTFLSKPYTNGMVIAILADGMGGHLAGEIASKTAVETIFIELDTLIEKNLSMEQYEEALKEAIFKANTIVYHKSLSNDQFKGMGTTIEVAIVNSEGLLLGHIGDSRAYLVDNKFIKQITTDHSLVNELLKNGQISNEEALDHPQKNILTRALGTDEEVQIDLSYISWEINETLLLCSDGLSNLVDDQKIFELVNQNLSVEETGDHLISLANEAGGDDNISIIVLRNK